MVVFPDDERWERGSSSLCPDRLCMPRIIHGACQQELPTTVHREEHTHAVYHICLVHRGRGSMVYRGGVTSTVAGSLLIVSPGEPHCFLLPPGEASCYSEVTFEVLNENEDAVLAPLHELLSEWSGRACTRWRCGNVVPPVMQKRMQSTLRRIVAGCLMPIRSRAFYANRALLDLLELVSEVLDPAISIVDDPLQEAADLIECNMHRALSVQAVAAEVGMSTNHFIRSFRQRFGETPLVYHQRNRIRAAQRLLTQTQYPIKLIAEWTGFSDVYYFSRLFSAKTGTPPAAYRRQKSGVRLPEGESPEE